MDYNEYKGQSTEQLAEPYYQDATKHHHRYLIATRLAAAVWAADVVYTFLKGRKNEKLKRAMSPKILVDRTGKTPVLGVQLRF